MYEEVLECHDVMVFEWKLIDTPDRVQMLMQKSAKALEYQSSAKHGKMLCQEINIHCNIHVLCRDIGPHGMCSGHRDVELVAV
jgi:GTP cyclohydrolase I